MNKIKVLLVDDHAIIRDGIRALLSLEDDIDIVGEASDGKEAVEKTRDLSPEVVVMDIVMPGMDGLEATRRITKRHHKTRVLVLTQYDNRQNILSAIKAGSAGYIPKSAMSSELVSAIRTVYNGNSFLCPSAVMTLIKDYRQCPKSIDSYDSLTTREKEILKLIAKGLTSREIANKLLVNLRTVMGHRTRIMEKLDLLNSTELIKFAIRKDSSDTDI